MYDKGDFDNVIEYILSQSFEQEKAVSMKILHEIYCLGIGDTRYRNKLKQRLQAHFTDTICFLSFAKPNNSEVIVHTDCHEGRLHYDQEENIKTVAKMLREDI